jgi:glycosyltransferase involved in cell wall biosynthesis
VIHANSIHACPYAIFAARLTGLPILWHNRDLVSHPWIHRALGRNVSQGIAISNSVAAHLRLQGIPTDRITTIRNGIRTDRFSGVPSLSRTEMNLPAAGPLVLMAGQFVPWKRHEDFIAAAALIARERPDARFIVAGAPLDSFQIRHRSELLKQIAAHDLSDVFVFSGFVSDMPSLYANCTCVAHPAVGEPFGRVVAEAMACGCPVVAVADSGPAELIQDRRDGLLVSPRSPESLAASVLRVLDDSALAGRLGAAAARRIRSDFSIERVGEEFLGLLNRVEKRGRQTAIHQGGKMRR